MCNAFNHAWDCDCGFGGDTGGGGGWRPSGGVSRFVSVAEVLERPLSTGWAKDSRGTVESYVNPNAHCPVCGALVYFYRSPYDGRVFFDELGWPWPKHPCTDNRHDPLRATRDSARASGSRPVPYWRLEGWRPLLFAKIHKGTDRERLTGDIDDRFSELLLPTGERVDAESPVFVRRQAAHPDIFEVTFLQSHPFGVQERKTVAFSPRIAALGEDVIFRATRGEVVAADVVGRVFLWRLDDPIAARPYLERAAAAGSVEALINLAIVALSAPGNN
jgi:hypothetical protein